MRKNIINEKTSIQKNISIYITFLLLLCASMAFGQTGTITGTVADLDGEPLIGVNVSVKGTTTGTITDINGKYTIPLVSAQGVLVFSYIGYVSQEITIGNQREINVRMREDTQNLEEVVVVGYGTRKAGELTGAVSTVRAEDIQKIPSVTSGEALRNVPGVTVLQSNTPGANPTIRVRGLGTMNNTDPLWVVDGVPGGNVDPNDIETITVLKDAAAQAIYGTRAANGVILVTTKQGRKNQRANVSVNLRAGNTRNTNYYDMLNTQEYGEMLWLQYKNSGMTPNHPLYGSGPEPVIPDYINPLRGVIGQVDESLYSYIPVQEGGPGYNQITRANKVGTEWLKEISRVAWYQDYSVNINGGSDNTTYSFTFGYLNQDGIMRFTGFDRLNLRSNIKTDVNKWLTIGHSIGASKTNQTGMLDNNGETSAVSFAYRNQPIIPVYDVGGNYASAGSAPGAQLGNSRSPLESLAKERFNVRKRMNLTANVYANLNIIEGLQFRTLVGLNHNTYHYKYIDYVNKSHAERVMYDALTVTHNVSEQWNWTNTLEYKKSFGLHNITLLVGTEAINNDYRQTAASRTEFISKDPNYIELSSGIQSQTNNSSVSSWALFSQLGRVNYVYDNKYMFEGVVRRDGSSRFAAGNRYGVFPAFSVGWVVSREKFMASTKGWLDNLKIRGGFGTTGNDQMENYNSYTTYNSTTSRSDGSYYMIGGANNGQGALGFRPSALGVSDVKWETTSTTNVAIDAAFLRNFNLTLDVWYRRTTDMLYPKAIPAVNGSYSAPNVNVGEMENRGFDLDIGYKGAALQNDLRYQLNLNISQYKNKVVKLTGAEGEFLDGGAYRQEIYTRTMTGTAFPEFFGYIVDGIFQTEAEASAHPVRVGLPNYNKPGHYKFRDYNGDGVINEDDRTFIGSPHPKFTGGLNFNFEYKMFDLNGQFYSSYGNKMVNQVSRWIDFVQFDGGRSKDRLYNSWGSPYLSDWSKARLPMAEVDDTSSQTASTAFIEDASYLRLRNLQLGCNLSKLLHVRDIKSLRVFLQVTNLFTFTKYSGLDPEVNISGTASRNNSRNYGVDAGSWPTPRQILFGVNIGL